MLRVGSPALKIHETIKCCRTVIIYFSRLRTIGSVGEPINVAAWTWLHEVVGNKNAEIVDTWWQTETGGNLITPRPSNENAEIIPGMAMRPFYGIQPVICDPASGKGLINTVTLLADKTTLNF